ncbi:MAG: hypothetical protein ACRD3N_00515 [Terracidiphilus sp.]
MNPHLNADKDDGRANRFEKLTPGGFHLAAAAGAAGAGGAGAVDATEYVTTEA